MRCVIFTAYLHGKVEAAYTPREGDLLLCADGGYRYAKKLGLRPHKIIGDMDSMGEQLFPEELLLRVPKEKDDTDTLLCLRYALSQGAKECLIVGGIGGRLDHTVANLQALAFAHTHGLHAEMVDTYERVFLMEGEERKLEKRAGTVSLFSYTEACEGVCISGVQYPLVDATLTHAFPLGVSNAFAEEHAHISVKKGILLVILSGR